MRNKDKLEKFDNIAVKDTSAAPGDATVRVRVTSDNVWYQDQKYPEGTELDIQADEVDKFGGNVEVVQGES